MVIYELNKESELNKDGKCDWSITSGLGTPSTAQHVSMAHVCVSALPCGGQLRRRIFLAPQRIAPASAAASSATDSVFTSASVSTSNYNPKVVVTRERGKNAKLITALVLYYLLSLLPCMILRFVCFNCIATATLCLISEAHTLSNYAVNVYFDSHSHILARFSSHLDLSFLVFSFTYSESVTCFCWNWQIFCHLGVWLKVEMNVNV